MIKKGEIKIGDYYYAIRSLGLLPYNINETLKVDKYVCTDIQDLDNGKIFLSCILKDGDSVYHMGQIGDSCFKSLLDVNEAIEKHKNAVIRRKKIELEKIQHDIQCFEESGFKIELVTMPFIDSAQKLTRNEEETL